MMLTRAAPVDAATATPLPAWENQVGFATGPFGFDCRITYMDGEPTGSVTATNAVFPAELAGPHYACKSLKVNDLGCGKDQA